MTRRFGSVAVVGLVAASALPVGCGGDANSSGSGGEPSHPAGGTSDGGKTVATGGAPGSGGTFVSGGTLAAGGNAVSGGKMSTSGGVTTTGTGGAVTPTSGGAIATGGAVTATGGAVTIRGGASGAGSGGRTSDGGEETAGAPSAGAPDAGAGGGGGIQLCSQTRSSRSARSAGFAGTYQGNYYPLYSTNCVTPADCASACVTAGGTSTSCAASECVDSTPDYCLPPTYWFDFDKLLVEASTEESSAWIIMVNNPYRDTLLVSNFQFELPAGANVAGVRFSFNRSADSPDAIGDYSVRALKDGAAVGLDRGKSSAWLTGFRYVDYGSQADLWGTTWTAEAINSNQFGVSFTPLYLDTAGNARAYIDFVKATVFYTASACN